VWSGPVALLWWKQFVRSCKERWESKISNTIG
jgi:hypothetical protein